MYRIATERLNRVSDWLAPQHLVQESASWLTAMYARAAAAR
jgi:hypothetical protein